MRIAGIRDTIDDPDDDVGEVLLDPRNVAEKIAGIHQRRDPGDRADHVVREETLIRHSGHTREERRERADDRNEAADDDRDSAVLVVEGLRLQQVLALEPARFGLVKHLRPDVVADRVVDRIAEDRRDDQHDHQNVHVEAGDRDDRSCDEQDRIAGQKRKDDEARFREDDQEQQAVEPGTVLGGEMRDGLVEREESSTEAS